MREVQAELLTRKKTANVITSLSLKYNTTKLPNAIKDFFMTNIISLAVVRATYCCNVMKSDMPHKFTL